MCDSRRSPHLRPSVQAESPGPLGINDSASPDNKQVPTSTPGPIGVNDRTESSGMSAGRIVLERLNNGWDALEKSRENLARLVERQDSEKKRATAWEAHRKLGLAYFALMKKYLRDHYDPNANWGAILRTGWLLRDEVLRQLIGDDTSDDFEASELTAKLCILHCQKAFEHYRETKDAESLFYCITLAAELQLISDEHSRQLPFAIKSRLQRMFNDTKPPTVEEAWQSWIRSLITGIKPGDPLWERELAKAASKPMDPIREHYERSKWQGDL